MRTVQHDQPREGSAPVAAATAPGVPRRKHRRRTSDEVARSVGFTYIPGASDIPVVDEVVMTRFWRHVHKPTEAEDSDACWTWTGMHNGPRSLSGRFWLDNHYVSAPRVAWAWATGHPLPDDQMLVLRATCAGDCMRPSHLRAVPRRGRMRTRLQTHEERTHNHSAVKRLDDRHAQALIQATHVVVEPPTLAPPIPAEDQAAFNRVSLALAQLEEAVRGLRPGDVAVYARHAGFSTVRAFYQTVAGIQRPLVRLERGFPARIRREVAAHYPNLVPTVPAADIQSNTSNKGAIS